MGIYQRFQEIVLQNPRQIAFVTEYEAIDYSTLSLKVSSNCLTLKKNGCQPGSRCIVSIPNGIETVVALLGIWRLGGIPVLVNEHAKLQYLEHAIKNTGATLCISNTTTHLDTPHSCTLLESKVLELTESSSLVLQPEHRVHNDEPASIVFTSGSSGNPKGVTQSHGTLIECCTTVTKLLNLSALDRILCPVPWSFDYGFGQLLTTLLSGITQIIPGSNTPTTICSAIEQFKPTVISGVPSLYATLCSGLSPIKSTNTNSVRLLTTTGSKISTGLIDLLRDNFKNAHISLNYGLTETYRSCSLPVVLAEQYPNSVGYPIPGVEIDIIKDNGKSADINEEGEIVHKGSGTFNGYWGDEKASTASLKKDPLWEHTGISPANVVYTGDYGYKNEMGLIFLIGRRDRLVKSMGVRTSLDEIEKIITECDLIREIAITSKAHDIVGDLVIAYIVPLKNDKDFLKRFKKWCTSCLNQYMQPREFHILESLPRTTTGKVDYPNLCSQH